ESGTGWRTMSLVLRRNTQLCRAQSAAKRAVSLEPGEIANHIELVRVLIDSNDFPNAEREALALAEEFPADGRSHNVLAEVYRRQARIDEALLAAKRGVALRPGDYSQYALLGHLFTQNREWQAAEAAFQAAIENNAGLGGFRFSFAQALFGQGKDDEALAIARELATVDNSHAHALVGHILARRSDLDGAEAAFQRAVCLAPAFEGFHRALYNVRARKDAITRNTISECRSYIEHHMVGKPRFSHRDELLTYSLSQITVDGLIMEFGVFSGHTINVIAANLPKRIV